MLAAAPTRRDKKIFQVTRQRQEALQFIGRRLAFAMLHANITAQNISLMHSPPAYMTASMMEEIHDTWLGVASKMASISLKNTVMDLGKA